MSTISANDSMPLRRVMLAHDVPPRIVFGDTLLGRPVIDLSRICRRVEAMSAVIQGRQDLIIIEPRLTDGDSVYLAQSIHDNLKGARPPILRVGDAKELQQPWPFTPHNFDLTQGVEAFNARLISLLGLVHRRAERYMIRLHFAERGAGTVLGQSLVMSKNGMLFSTFKRLSVGAMLELELMGVTGLRGERITAVVLRQEGLRSSMPQYALQFRDLSPEMKHRLEQFLADDSGGILHSPADPSGAPSGPMQHRRSS